MIKFEIKNRWTGEVKFIAEIDDNKGDSHALKMGLAVKWAISQAADLTGADLTAADLTAADLTAAGLAIPAIDKIDAKMLSAIESGGKLEMERWHACKTIHCRAGWAVFLAGYYGGLLESKIGTECAARLIYETSRPGKPAPNFYATNDGAMADIKACAAEQNKELTK